MAPRIKIKEIRFYLREIETRLPFRFGAFTLREVPLLHLALAAETESGTRVKGFAADNLMPKWFDKDPAKSPIDNINGLLSSARFAREFYTESGRNAATPWAIWREAYPACLRRGKEQGATPLVASFGSSLLERALVDAAGKLANQDLVGVLRNNLLGMDPADIHPELDYGHILAWAGKEPPPAVAVRHTVGLLDPLDGADSAEGSLPPDGFPVTLEEYVLRYGLRCFKLKIGGRIEEDLERLQAVARLLDRLISRPYLVTLDGNEQYRSFEEILDLIRRLRENPKLTRFCRSIAFLEQPLDRGVSLEPALKGKIGELSEMLPVIIDESDDRLAALKTAASLGYRGVSAKNCKGIMKSFLNRALIEELNRRRPENRRLFMTAEDLTNVPIVPLNQDLAAVRALGISHAERNGYHYVRGLAHCSERERDLAIRRHGDLYGGDSGEAFMRIENGQIRVDSLALPGLGVAFEPDFDSMQELSLSPSSLPPPVKGGENGLG